MAYGVRGYRPLGLVPPLHEDEFGPLLYGQVRLDYLEEALLVKDEERRRGFEMLKAMISQGARCPKVKTYRLSATNFIREVTRARAAGAKHGFLPSLDSKSAYKPRIAVRRQSASLNRLLALVA